MSKIEEMAMKAADKMWGKTDPHDYTDHSGVGAAHANYKVGYIDGANAVLREIEEFIKVIEMNGYNYIFCEFLKDKIKRLKGE